MRLFALGTVTRHEGPPDPEQGLVFYDVGKQLQFELMPWFIVGIAPRKYAWRFFLGPVVVTLFYRRAG